MEKDKSSSELANRKSYDYKKNPLFFKNFRKNKLNLFGPWKSIYIVNSKLSPNSTWSNIYNEDIYRNRIDDRIFVSELSSERINNFLDFYFPFNLPIDFNDRNKIFIINKNNRSMINSSFRNEPIINSYSNKRHLSDTITPSVISIDYQNISKKEITSHKPLEIEIFPEVIQTNMFDKFVKHTELPVDFNTKKVAIPSNVLIETSKSVNSLFSPSVIEVDYVSVIDKITPNNIEVDNLLNIPKQIISTPDDIMLQTIEVYSDFHTKPNDIEVYTKPFDIFISSPIQLDLIHDTKEFVPSWIEVIPSEIITSTTPSDIGIEYQKPIISEVQIPSTVSLEISKINILNASPIQIETISKPVDFVPDEISLQYQEVIKPTINNPAEIALEVSKIDVLDSLPVEIETLNKSPILSPEDISLQYEEIIKPVISAPTDIALETSKIDVLDVSPIEVETTSEPVDFVPDEISLQYQEVIKPTINNPAEIALEVSKIDVLDSLPVEIETLNKSPILSPEDISLQYEEIIKPVISAPADIALETSKIDVLDASPIEIETTSKPVDFVPDEISLQYQEVIKPTINNPAEITLEVSKIDVLDSLPVEIETLNKSPILSPEDISLQYEEIVKPIINNPADIALEVSKIDVLDSLPIELTFINSSKEEFVPSNINLDFEEPKIFELSTPNYIEINDNFSKPVFSPSYIELELSETLLDEPYKQTVIIEKEIPVEVEKNIYIPVEINKPYEVIKEVEKIVYVDKPYEVIKEVPILSIKEIPIIKPVEIFVQQEPEIVEKEKYIVQDNIQFVDLPKEQDIKYVQTYQEVPSNDIKVDKPILNDKDQDVPILIVPEQNEPKVLNDTESIEISTKKIRQKNKKPYITLYNGNKPMTSDNIIEKYSLDKDNLGLMKVKKRRSKN